MVTEAENELLTRVEGDAPMGRLVTTSLSRICGYLHLTHLVSMLLLREADLVENLKQNIY
jgi:hypothetical protein